MSRAKIALFLPSLAGGGAERVFVELANEFANLGLNVDLTLASANGPYLEEISRAVRIVDFRASGVSRSLPRLSRYLRTERPDAMISALEHANVIAVLARQLAGSKVRSAVSVRGVPSMLRMEAGRFGAWSTLQAARLAYRFADAIMANSEAVASDLSRYMRIPQSRIHVIYNPINTSAIERASRAPLNHEWCEYGSPPIILSVGRLSGLKDFPTLIRAFGTLRARRACRLVILGEGPDRCRLEAQIAEQGLSPDVLLPGFVDNPFAWMRHAQLFVSSSLSEGCPNGLMQALACGVPVVSTDAVGGSAEILEQGKWGSLVPIGNADAMAQAMDAALNAEPQVDGRDRVREFTPDKIAKQYLRVLLPYSESFTD